MELLNAAILIATGIVIALIFYRAILRLLFYLGMTVAVVIAYAGALVANEQLRDPHTLGSYLIGGLVGFLVLGASPVFIAIRNALIDIDARIAIDRIRKQSQDRRS